MIKMYINNEEIVSNQTFTITEEMLKTSSTILNNTYPATWENDKDYVSRYYYPKDYSKCKILKDDELIFCGVVKNSGSISLRPTMPKYCSLQILDFKTFLSEGETLDFVISNKTVLQAIQMVVSACQDYGVVLGNVEILNPNDIIGAYSTLDKTPYDVFQYLAEVSQSRWFTRMTSENIIAVDFYDPTLMPKGTSIEYTTQWYEDNEIEDLTFSYSSSDYRNKQVMLSDKVFADIDYTETLTADGYSEKVYTNESVGTIKSITINNVAQTFTTNANKELGASADFYYTTDSNEITSDSTLGAGTRIIIVYTPIIKGRQVIRNDSEVERIEGLIDRKGVVSRYEDRNDATTSQELLAIGKTYIKYKGVPEVTLTVKTFKNIWDIGQVVQFNAPLSELTTEYMVKKKQTKIIASVDKVFYTYTMTSSFNSETEINYFDNQRNKKNGNLTDGQFISRNVDIESKADIIFDNLEISSQTFNDNVLNCTLDSTFTQ